MIWFILFLALLAGLAFVLLVYELSIWLEHRDDRLFEEEPNLDNLLPFGNVQRRDSRPSAPSSRGRNL
jgi:hypothetical protein